MDAEASGAGPGLRVADGNILGNGQAEDSYEDRTRSCRVRREATSGQPHSDLTGSGQGVPRSSRASTPGSLAPRAGGSSAVSREELGFRLHSGLEKGCISAVHRSCVPRVPRSLDLFGILPVGIAAFRRATTSPPDLAPTCTNACVGAPRPRLLRMNPEWKSSAWHSGCGASGGLNQRISTRCQA